MYDVAIIGTGAAGISAALTLKALKKNIIWFGSRSFSEKIRKAERILNYPGLSAVSGKEMMEAFAKQAQDMEIGITEKTVTGVYAMGDYYGILCDKESFEARTVILATGVESVKPLEGELAFLGRGVSYCATCDGLLYRDKTVAVVCASREYEHEAAYLAELAKQVYFLPLYPSPSLEGANIETVLGRPRAVTGTKKADKLVLADRELSVDGIFFLKAAISPSALVGGLSAQDGHVTVDRNMATNLPGLFAAGDCTGRPYQYAKAVGEGNVAAHAAAQYLLKFKSQS